MSTSPTPRAKRTDPARSPSERPPKIPTGPKDHFLLILGTVLALTLLSMVLAFYLSLMPTERITPAMGDMSKVLTHAFTLGVGAIVGLLGGRRTNA
jgi:hypothetical protein